MKYFLLALSLTIAVVGSITDIRRGIVKNTHLMITFLILAASVLISIVFIQDISTFPYFYYFLNLALSAALSIAFYYMDIWAPGDVKIYLLITAIYPFSCYSCRPGNIFPALDLVIIAFASGYIFLLITSFLQKEKANWTGRNIISWFSKRTLLRFVANIGFFSFVQLLLRLVLPAFYESNRSLCILITAGAVYLLDRAAPTIKLVLGYLMFLLYIGLSFWHGDLYRFIFGIGESILLAAVFGEIGRIIKTNSYSEVNEENVKPGMILSFSSIWAMQKCIDPNIPRTTTESRRSRITVEQAEAVRNWCRITKRNITVVDMLPFIPMLAFGLLIQILRYFVTIY